MPKYVPPSQPEDAIATVDVEYVHFRFGGTNPNPSIAGGPQSVSLRFAYTTANGVVKQRSNEITLAGSDAVDAVLEAVRKMGKAAGNEKQHDKFVAAIVQAVSDAGMLPKDVTL